MLQTSDTLACKKPPLPLHNLQFSGNRLYRLWFASCAIVRWHLPGSHFIFRIKKWILVLHCLGECGVLMLVMSSHLWWMWCFGAGDVQPSVVNVVMWQSKKWTVQARPGCNWLYWPRFGNSDELWSSVARSPFHLYQPQSKALLMKLIVPQLVEKVPAFYGTWIFIIMFTRAFLFSLSWTRLIQSMPTHPVPLTSYLIWLSHLFLGVLSVLFPLDASSNMFMHFCSSTNMPHAPAVLSILIWSPWCCLIER